MCAFKLVEGKVKVENYTPAMIAIIESYVPINYAKAKIIGGLINRSPKSVVSKTKNLGLEYISKPPATKKVAPRTKAQTVKLIEAESFADLTGLSVAPASVLNKLLALFQTANDAINDANGINDELEEEALAEEALASKAANAAV